MGLRIVQLARRLDQNEWGGTETVVLETSRQLLAKGHYTEILCTNVAQGAMRERIQNVDVRRYPYFYPYWGLSDASKNLLDRRGGSPFSMALLRALQAFPDLDLIHVHAGNRIGGIGRHVARKRRIPYVVSVHGGAFDIPEENRRELAAPTRGAFDWGKVLGWWVGSRRVFLDASAIICVGQNEQRATQEQFPDKKVVYLPNGVDVARFERGDPDAFRRKYGISSDAFVLLTVGRIDSQKNQLTLIKAFPKIREQVPRAHLVIVGPVTNAAYHDRIVNELEVLGLSSSVTLITGMPAGSQELVNTYHGSDLFVLPSVHEPFGIVILEAWAVGLPVVASNVGGIPHFVSDGEDCILFNVNAEDELVRSVVGVATDEQRRNAMRTAGENKVRREYGWDRITDRLIALYEEAKCENPLRK